MAVKYLHTSSDLSTSAGSWYHGGATNLDWGGFAGAYDIDFNSATRTIAVTFDQNSNQRGLLLCFHNGLYGTLTIKLQENSGGWTDRTTNAFDLTVLKPCNVVSTTSWYFFALDNYAVTTAPATWRYSISCTSASTLAYVTTSDGTNLLYTAFTDYSSAKIASNDTLVIGNGVTLTLDESLTLAKTTDITAIQCTNSIFQWKNPPSASYTLTCPCGWFLSTGTSFIIGSSASPISYANRAIIDASGGIASDGFCISTGTSSYNNYPIFELYGAENSYMGDIINGDAAGSQKDVVTTTDLSAIWQVGDTVSFIGKYRPGVATYDNATYTIASFSGKTITLNTNLDYMVINGAFMVNDTHAERNCGIKILGITSNYISFPYSALGTGSGVEHCQIAGVYGLYIGFIQFVSYTTAVVTSLVLNTNKTNLFRNLFSSRNAVIPAFWCGGHNMTCQNLYSHTTSSATANSLHSNFIGNNMTLTNIMGKNHNSATYGGIYIVGNSITLNNLVFSGGRNAAGYTSLFITGAAWTANNIYVISPLCQYGIKMSLVASELTNLVASDTSGNTSGYGYDLYLSGCSDLIMNNPKLGTYDVATTSEIYCVEDTLVTVTFKNADIGATVTDLYDNLENTLTPSWLAFDTYDTTANDHRVFKFYGNFQSTGDGLTDTTVHTSGTGKFAIRFEPTSSTSNLDWDIDIPTGNISTKTMFVGVWCKINNATYYAGTHQLPRLTIDYDNGTIAYAQAAETTDWQLLVVPFTPATSYGQITATISGRTDATTTDAYIYWDDFMVSYPPSVALDLGGMDVWANALPVVPPLAIPISAGTVASGVWEELLSAHTTSATFGKHVAKKLLTLSKFIGLK